MVSSRQVEHRFRIDGIGGEMTNPDEVQEALNEFKQGASTKDYAHAAIRGIASAVPVVGGIGAELYATAIAPPLEMRRDRLLVLLAEGVIELSNHSPSFTADRL